MILSGEYPQEIVKFLEGDWCTHFTHKRILHNKYIYNVNGGSLFWNPPFFVDCYFTAPRMLFVIVAG